MARFENALEAIDAAHALDPTESDAGCPYELHYARRCSWYLDLRLPEASETLRLAVRAQHFRRWETPRSDYPMTKSGYLTWRLNAKKRAASLVEEIMRRCDYSVADAARVGSLIRKEELKVDVETQALEDVACLVFLDDQFEAFSKDHNEDKILNILRKTWGKMSDQGRQLALNMKLEGESKLLMEKALAG